MGSTSYNSVSISLYGCDQSNYRAIKHSSRLDVDVMSFFVPIISRSYNFVMDMNGDSCRAVLVKDLYATDWMLCLIGLAFSLPSLRAVFRASVDAAIGKTPISISKKAYQGLNMWFYIIIVGSIVTIGESWCGWFSTTPSPYFNNVAKLDSDLYRLCLFIPLALLFTSMSGIFISVRWLRKGK